METQLESCISINIILIFCHNSNVRAGGAKLSSVESRLWDIKAMKNVNAEEANPCLKEQELTYKCFNENNFVKETCKLQIENYKLCKGFWNSIRADRRRRGITPYLPPHNEREDVKREFLTKNK